MPLLLLGIALIIGMVLLLRGFLNAEPRALAQIVRWTAGIVGALVVWLLIETGREGLLVPLILIIAPMLWRRGRWRRWFGLGGTGAGTPGRTSQIETPLLRMTLDLDSGALSGEVLAGRFQGRSLDGLDFDQVIDLLTECRAQDAQSVTLLEAWLDRTQGAGWRTRTRPAAAGSGGGGGGGGGGAMDREEALSVLGLDSDAGPDAIKEAHRRLMAKVHPDHGGSTWLAAKLNQARDLLLGS